GTAAARRGGATRVRAAPPTARSAAALPENVRATRRDGRAALRSRASCEPETLREHPPGSGEDRTGVALDGHDGHAPRLASGTRQKSRAHALVERQRRRLETPRDR